MSATYMQKIVRTVHVMDLDSNETDAFEVPNDGNAVLRHVEPTMNDTIIVYWSVAV